MSIEQLGFFLACQTLTVTQIIYFQLVYLCISNKNYNFKNETVHTIKHFRYMLHFHTVSLKCPCIAVTDYQESQYGEHLSCRLK